MANAVVVGGGLAGMLSALLAARSGERVVLIERAAQLGGLAASLVHGEHHFDRGPCFAYATGVPELDELVLEPLRSEPGFESFVPAPASYFRGSLNPNGESPDLRHLPPASYQRGVVELLDAPRRGKQRRLDRELADRFGAEVASRVFEPIVRKLFATDPSELTSGALDHTVPTRVTALKPATATLMRKLPELAGVLASHTRDAEGPSAIYPARAGAGARVDQLAQQLERAEVRVITGTRVEAIERSGHRATHVRAGGERLPCEHLIWTGGADSCLLAAGVPPPGEPARARRTALFHLVFDLPFASSASTVLCWDEALHTFRVTLYPSFTQPRGKGYPCTVEVVDDVPYTGDAARDLIAAELHAMGIVSPDARLIDSTTEVVHDALPVPTPQRAARSRANAAAASELMGNLKLVGRAAGSERAPERVLREVWHALG